MLSLMHGHIPYILLWVIVWISIGYLLSKLYFWSHLQHERKQAVSRSKAVVLGHVSEAIAPLLPSFPYHYKDVMFLGKWVDYIVFDWLYTWSLRNIIFLEVKSWSSRLNANERMIQECVRRGSVVYDTYRL